MTNGEAVRRTRMVQGLAARGIRDERVLDAMQRIPRHLFVPPAHRDEAYLDTALPLATSATVSQPYIVALMMESLLLTGAECGLEIGTGSGYGAAVFAALVHELVTIEMDPVLADTATTNLESCEAAAGGCDNIRIVTGDGALGYPPGAPYDAISVTAAAREVPHALSDQLAEGGRLVIPLGGRRRAQQLIRIVKVGARLRRDDLAAVRFVPLRRSSDTV